MGGSELVVYSGDEEDVLAVGAQESMHGFECGPGGDEVVEEDNVGLRRKGVEGEDGVDALTCAA